ncbi:hypothetical protein C5S36_03605 [Candidatus Methanophagaceae archaeon]|nr:hypothetical protein C5S36_03605 [Methanophagales archaeon]
MSTKRVNCHSPLLSPINPFSLSPIYKPEESELVSRDWKQKTKSDDATQVVKEKVKIVKMSSTVPLLRSPSVVQTSI